MYDQDNSGAISPEEMVEIFTLMYSVQVGGVPAGRKHRYYNTLFNNVPHPTFFKCSKINFLTRCFTLNAVCRAAQRRTQCRSTSTPTGPTKRTEEAPAGACGSTMVAWCRAGAEDKAV